MGMSVLVLSSSPYSSAAAAFSVSCLIFRPVLIYPNGRHSTEEDRKTAAICINLGCHNHISIHSPYIAFRVPPSPAAMNMQTP